MPSFPKILQQKLVRRQEENALRRLELPKGLIDFSSNDYLGLAKEKEIKLISYEIEKVYGFALGATGSRLLSGNHPLYEKLESFVAEFHKAETALVFNSGYDANLGFFASVPQRNDIVFYDELSHASIRDGIKLGNAKAYKFKHNDLEDLTTKLVSLQAQSKIKYDEIYVVTESVFSMDGDSPDLIALTDFCTQKNIHLIVDEAHAVGVFNKGLVHKLNLEKSVFARIVTFGKALGCHGAAILGGSELKNYLVNFSRSFIYTTAPPPNAMAHVLAAYQILQKTNESKLADLNENIVFFQNQIKKLQLESKYIKSNSAIQCIMISGNSAVKKASFNLKESGYDVRPILSPTVTKGKERLRFCLHSFNTKEEIESVLNILAKHVSD